ncbi:MAG: RHS repeat-associated core domain-containing protein [Chloroflexi bacterium]|nr:RHS repeat-associated core domain-containing protein [Chloroflexota bacterium]
MGSVSLTTNASGGLVSQSRYLPYGETRWGSSGPTDFGFTGQRNEAGFGLMDYGARYYSPGLGRFVSPDTVVPGAGNPQAWNRYSYVGNNPLKYSDTSGHCWGFASGMRGSFYGTTCNNLDMAGIILTSPDATIGQKFEAWAYIDAIAISHAVAVGGLVAAGVGCATGAGTVICAGAGTAATAASADGNPIDEVAAAGNTISQLGASEAQALNEFADSVSNKVFENYWRDLASRISQSPNIANNVFVEKSGDRVVGAMEVVNRANALEVNVLQSLERGSGTGTRLMQSAVQESMARGY